MSQASAAMPPESRPGEPELADRYIEVSARVASLRRRLAVERERLEALGRRLAGGGRGRILVRGGHAILVPRSGRPHAYPVADLDEAEDLAAADSAGRGEVDGVRVLSGFVRMASDAGRGEAADVAVEIGHLGFAGTSAEFVGLVDRILDRNRGAPDSDQFPRISDHDPAAVLDPRD